MRAASGESRREKRESSFSMSETEPVKWMENQREEKPDGWRMQRIIKWMIKTRMRHSSLESEEWKP
jgi:hypothetical protein